MFFFSFHFVLNMFLMPIFIGTVVEGYAEIKEQESSAITRNFIFKITEEWARIDREAEGRISCEELWLFCPVFMKIFSEEKSLKNFDISLFLASKSDFFEAASIRTFEEEGVAFVSFHGLVLGLTRLYLERVSKRSIREVKAHTLVELKTEYGQFGTKAYFSEEHMCKASLLKAGLSNWKKRTKEPSDKKADKLSEEQV